MKRIVFFAVMMACVLAVCAGNRVKLIEGDKSIFMEAYVANVVIDDHTTMIDGKDKPADVYYREKSEAEYEKFVNDLDRAHKSFVTYFNEKKPGKVKFEMADSATTADYTLQITVTTMNVGNAGGFAWGLSRKAGGAQIEGTMQLVDNTTGEVVCKFEFEKVKGLLAPVFKARAISVYRYLADELLKTVKK